MGLKTDVSPGRISKILNRDIDQFRLDRQVEFLQKWVDNECRGTFEAVTGIGKTLVGILGAEHIVESYSGDVDNKIIVTVPTDYLRDKWRDTLKQFGLEGVSYVDTVHNQIKSDHKCLIHILDEIHMYLGKKAEHFPTVFKRISSRSVMGLTATLGEEGILRIVVNANCPVLDKVGTQQAVDNGWVSEYITYNLGIPFTEEDRREYEKLNKKFQKYFSTFLYNSDQFNMNAFDIAVKCSQSESFTRRFARAIGWQSKMVRIHAVQMLRSVQQRKRFLYNAPAKIDATSQIVSRFPDRKIICFSQSTNFADKLASRIGDQAVAYHSNIPTQIKVSGKLVAVGEDTDNGIRYRDLEDNILYNWDEIKSKYSSPKRYGTTRLRKKAIKEFTDNRYKARVLCTARAADVGVDIDDITMGIINSGTSKDRQDIQRRGRTIRYLPGKRAIIVQIYIMDSQDERWLKKRQKDDPNVHWIYSPEDIV